MRVEKIINGLLENDNKVLRHIYENYFKSIEGFVIANRGTTEDAWDVFQEGLIILLQKLRADKDAVEVSFKGYLYGTCRYIWVYKLHRIIKRGDVALDLSDDYLPKYEFDQVLNDMEVLANKETRERIFQEAYLNLKTDCRTIIELIINGCEIKEIKDYMQFTSIKYVYRKRQFCREKLLEKIKLELSTKYQKS